MNSAPQRHSLSVIEPDSASQPPITSCEGCGICCTEQSLPPFLDEIDFVPADLQRQVLEARKHEADFAGQPCLWWDKSTRKCMHHNDRPNICREFEIGGECCLEIRARLLVSADQAKTNDP